MSCFICSTKLLGAADPSKSSHNAATPKKLRISTICKLLLASCSLNNNSSIYRQNVTSQEEEDDETCDLCPNCGPVMTEMEEIRGKMRLQEDQIRTKFGQIRATIFSSARHNQGQDKLRKMREIILRVTDGMDDQMMNEDFTTTSDEIKVKEEVKEEQVEFDDDTGTDGYEKLLTNTSHPSHPTNSEVGSVQEDEVNVDPPQLNDDAQDDSESCSQNKQNSKPAKTQKPTKSRNDQIKRKPEVEKQDGATLPIKRAKREPPRPTLQKTRFSPRPRKNQAEPPKETTTNKKNISQILPLRSKPKPKTDDDRTAKSDPENYDEEDSTVVDDRVVITPKKRRRRRSRSGMERHVRIHQTGERPEKCDQCEASFIDKVALSNHTARGHSSTKEYICNICGKVFRLRNTLTKHVYRHKARAKCETCGENFRGNDTLQSHRIRVHGADPLVCDECGATFLSAGGLYLHKKSHKGIQRHQCEICGIFIISKYHLVLHRKFHTNERPHPCSHCDRAFKRKQSLADHVLQMHTPGYVAPIRGSCPHCGKDFTKNANLQAHIRQVHTGERPFVCDQAGCGKGFSVKNTLLLHLKARHGIVTEKQKSDRLPPGRKNRVTQK